MVRFYVKRVFNPDIEQSDEEINAALAKVPPMWRNAVAEEVAMQRNK